MFVPWPGHWAGSKRCALALFLLGIAPPAPSPAADTSEILAILNSTAAKHDSAIRAIHSRLIEEKRKIDTLLAMRKQGHASWLEVAEQEARLAFLAADRQAAQELSSFTEALAQRAKTCARMDERDTSSELENAPRLTATTLAIAAALAQSRGQGPASDAAVALQQFQLTALELLHSQGLASQSELASARQTLLAAQALAKELAARRRADVQAFHHLTQSSADFAALDCAATATSEELHFEALPPRLFACRDSIQTLLALRQERIDLAARGEHCTVRLNVLAELLRRLEATPNRTDRAQRESHWIWLNIAYVEALQLATTEQAEILRLAEHLVPIPGGRPQAQFVLQRQQTEPASWDVIEQIGSRTQVAAERRLSLPAAIVKSSSPGLAPYQASKQTTFSVEPFALPPPLPAKREPHYADYYANGIRFPSPSLPPAIRRGFFNGGLPWYLPGSTTNFK